MVIMGRSLLIVPRRRSSYLRTRVTLPDGSVRFSVQGGMFFQVHFGYTISRTVFEAVTDEIYQTIISFVENHDEMTENLDFYCRNIATGTQWNYFAYLAPLSVQKVSSTMLQLAFASLYTVLAKDVDTGVSRPLPYLARSWELFAPDGRTPVLMGYFREKFGGH